MGLPSVAPKPKSPPRGPQRPGAERGPPRVSAERGNFRIIGGEWRRRRFAFNGDGSIRPTADRLRETLFNWLMPFTDGARCLDLFAGSGALGLEALSRGAAHCDFVDKAPGVIADLRAILAMLNTGARAELHCSDGIQRLPALARHYDLVFLDPPYRQRLIEAALAALPQRLAPGHRVFVEHPEDEPVAWPPGWQVLKQYRAGQSLGELVRWEDPAHNPAQGELS